MALDPEKNFDPITGDFRYAPQWQGALSGRSFEQQTEDAINYLRGLISDITGGATPSDTLPRPAGTASVGTSASYSRGDHVHPAQTTITGNAATATKLKTTRNIILSGDASGSGPFDGSSNCTIPVTISTASTDNAGMMSSADKQKLDGISAGANAYVLPAATAATMGGVRIMTTAEIMEIINEVFYS